MHYYFLHPKAAGVACCSWVVKGAPTTQALSPVCVETSDAARRLAQQGAVAPTDFEGLVAALASQPAAAAAAASPAAPPGMDSAAPSPPPPRLLKSFFKKTFHVSPFMGMDQVRDCDGILVIRLLKSRCRGPCCV